jgi:hypothetical protein
MRTYWGKGICAVATMSRFLFLSLFLFGNPFLGSAQEIDYGNKEIGVDLLGLVFNSGQVNQSFFFKSLKLKQKKEGFGFVRRGYRLRLGYDFFRPDPKWSGPKTPSIRFRSALVSESSFLIRAGYEWRRRIKSIEFVYGIDINASQSSRTDIQYSWLIVPDSFIELTDYSREFYLGFSPIGGFYYHFGSSYAVAVESALFFDYFNSKYTEKQFNQQTMEETFSKLSGQGYRFSAAPIYTVSFMVKF